MYELICLHFQIFRISLRNLNKEDLLKSGILFFIFSIVIAGGTVFACEGFTFLQQLPAMSEILTDGLIP